MITLMLKTKRHAEHLPPAPDDVYFARGWSLASALDQARAYGHELFVAGWLPDVRAAPEDAEYRLYRVRNVDQAWYTGWRWLPSFGNFVFVNDACLERV